MPDSVDIVLMGFLGVSVLRNHFYEVPRFLRDVESGRPGARLSFYRRVAISEWAFAAVVLVAWLARRRSRALLGLSFPAGTRLVVGALLCAVLAALMIIQARRIARLSPEKLDKMRRRLTPSIEALVPHTEKERNAFVLLSLTAGVCEELLARGYLIWFFGSWTGNWGGLVISSVMFGLGHAYQGGRGVVKTSMAGLAFGAVYIGTRSLLPGMLLHTIIDVGGGAAGFELVRERGAPVAAAGSS